jgi:putative hemolysin
MITLILVFFGCLLLSMFFSSSEMAFVSANPVKIRELSDKGNKKAQKTLQLLEQHQEFLAVILIGNNVVNIIATSIFTYFLEMQLGIANEWVVTLVMAPILIVFCETIPKDYARLRSNSVILNFTGFLSFFLKIARIPVRWILRAIDMLLGSMSSSEEAVEKSIFVSEKEFRLLIEESAQSGVLAHHEKQLIDTIMDFERIKIESIMVPFEKTEKVDITDSIGKVKQLARESGAKMVLVSEEIPTLVVGMIYIFDILFEPDEKSGFKKYLRSPIFLHKSTSIEKAFLTLQERRQSYAAVTDDDGEVIGVIAIEKLFTS